MDVLGGPIETPTLRRIAERGLRYSNFHTTALCSPTRSSLLNGRNATSNNMACITEASAGFPGFSARIPFENGTIAEVLNERGWNTYAIGKWHLTPGDEVDLSAWKGRWPLGRGFERFYGFLGGETSQWYPRPRLRQPLRRAARTAAGRLPPERGPDRPRDGVRPRREVGRAGQAVVHVLLPRLRARAAHHVFKEWADRYRAASTRAMKRSAPRSSPTAAARPARR
jgi:arylsulfatase A-like enzyme